MDPLSFLTDADLLLSLQPVLIVSKTQDAIKLADIYLHMYSLHSQSSPTYVHVQLFLLWIFCTKPDRGKVVAPNESIWSRGTASEQCHGNRVNKSVLGIP